MDRLIEWLPAHIPASARDDAQVSIVHGDYRLDNLVFHPTEPRIVAVLDWELSTLGHPLADFSYHCMSWHIAPGGGHRSRGIGGLDLAALGIPSEDEYVRRYCERTGRGDPDAVMADWNFYLAYNLFRIAGILQGIAKRVEAGTASSAQARQSAAGARPLAEMGWRIAQQSLSRRRHPSTQRKDHHGLRIFTPDQGTAGAAAALHGRPHLSRPRSATTRSSRPTPRPASAGRRCRRSRS